MAMANGEDHERAAELEDLGRRLLERVNSEDLEGIVSLYESDAFLASSDGELSIDSKAISWALRHCDLAHTSTRFRGEASAEVAQSITAPWKWKRVGRFVPSLSWAALTDLPPPAWSPSGCCRRNGG
jgi:hypothetical protein